MKLKKEKKISYYDVTSLYPFTNFITNYPIGHPTVHNLNEEVNWTTSADNKYQLALMKVFVIPPKTIDIPILPV
uniref:DNA-directed DNA polymerase n=1 Tax=Meloidogyne incognita TaxID=6306 RepID=A0A914LV00_MELIC